MKVSIILATCFTFGACFNPAFAGTATTGGLNQSCESRTITCDSGPNIACNASPDNPTDHTQCTSQWGPEATDGWVNCKVYDIEGRVTSSVSKNCPNSNDPSSTPSGSMSNGGLNQKCSVTKVKCSSGRTITCFASPDQSGDRTRCMANWSSSSGNVSCSVYDTQGFLTSQFSDECP